MPADHCLIQMFSPNVAVFVSCQKNATVWVFFPYNILTFSSSFNMVVLAGSVSGLWICGTIFLLHKTKCSLCSVAQLACLSCTRSCFQSSAFIKQAHWPTCNSGTWEVGTGRSEIQGHPWWQGVQSQPRLEILSQKIKLKLRILRMEIQLRVGGETRYSMCVKNLKIFLKLSLKFLHWGSPES